MKTKNIKTKLLTALLTLCMVLSLVPITAFAAEIDFLPQGVTYFKDNKHTYHTQVNVTANVSVKDSDDTVVETKQVTKSTEEFLKGGVGMLQKNLANLQTEIETPYQAKGTVTRENESSQTILDHFETASFYTFTPTSGDPVEFSTDLDAAKQYFNEHTGATGTFTELLDIHEYRKVNYTYDLTVTMPTVTVIDVVEINGVTVSFKDGDKPVFTGKVPDGADYAFRCEWWELDSKTGAMSTDFGNFYENKFTAFEAEKTYHYGVFVSAYGDVGNVRYVFGPDTKLKINGEFVNYKRYEGDIPDFSDGTTMSMWVLTDLSMTPQASGKAPDYKITDGANGSWMQNSDGTLKFVANGDFSKFTGVKVDGALIAADKYTAASGSTVITLKKNYLDTLSVGKHTLTVVYNDGDCSTEFEIKVAQSKTVQSESKIARTSDNNGVLPWIALLFVSGEAAIATSVIRRKKNS